MSEGTQTISFRVPTALAKRLEESGVQQGLSRNELARKLVEQALMTPSAPELMVEFRALRELIAQNQPASNGQLPRKGCDALVPELLREVRRVHAHLDQLRTALATGVTALLVQAGEVDAAQAEAWVTQHMFSAT